MAGDEVAGESFAELTGILPPQKMANRPSMRKTAARAPPIQTQLLSCSSSNRFVSRSIILNPPEQPPVKTFFQEVRSGRDQW
jgi:hypothetical protein